MLVNYFKNNVNKTCEFNKEYLYLSYTQTKYLEIMKVTQNITELEFNNLKTSLLTYDEMTKLINSIKVEGKSLTGSRQTSKLWCILINY